MTQKQEVLAELLKLKSHLIHQLATHNLTVYTQTMLERINTIIELTAQE